MNGRLLWVSPLHVGMVSAFAGALLAYLVVGAMVVQNQFSAKPPTFNYLNGLILFPLGVSFCVFVFAALSALLYNVVAKRGGWISARVEPSPAPATMEAARGDGPAGALGKREQSPPHMRIPYDFGYLDYLYFLLMQQFLSPILQGAILLGVGYIFVSDLKDNPLGTSLLMALFWYAVIWAAQVAILAAFLFTRRRDSALTDHVIEIRDDAIYESTRFNESRFLWSGILRLVERPGYVAVYVSQHAAHVIPMRAFQSKEQRAQFISLIKEKMKLG
jgi:hypothetical protein